MMATKFAAYERDPDGREDDEFKYYVASVAEDGEDIDEWFCDCILRRDAERIAHGLTLLEQVKAGELLALTPDQLRKVMLESVNQIVGQLTPVSATGPSNMELAA